MDKIDLLNKIILISGPTATGKTKTSIQLAKSLALAGLNAQVINFDSLLFYKEISIGTAKPTAIEQSGIPHHLISINSITEELNASHYIDLAKKLITEFHDKKIIPILVGGSAFYLRALIKGMYAENDIANSDKNIIKVKWQTIVKNSGINPVIHFLKVNDPEALTIYHTNDHYRLIRAAEHFDLTGNKISIQKKSFDDLNPYDFSSSNYNLLHFYLDIPKDLHFEYIFKRVHEMLENGLIGEVEQLLKNGHSKKLKPLQSIGYKETIDFLEGKISSTEELRELIAIHTRQLAKSQRTFFKKITPKIELNPLIDHGKIEKQSLEFLKKM